MEVLEQLWGAQKTVDKIKKEFPTLRRSIVSLARSLTNVEDQSKLPADARTRILKKVVTDFGRIYAKLNNKVNLDKIDQFERYASQHVSGVFNQNMVKLLNNILSHSNNEDAFFDAIAGVYEDVKTRMEEETGKAVGKVRKEVRGMMNNKDLLKTLAGKVGVASFHRLR